MSRPEEDLSAQREAIIEAAAADPAKSAAELAEQVPNATPELVEQVLSDRDVETDTDGAEPAGGEAYPDREDISDRQIKTLQAIAAHPDATQRDIASFLDVTAATVSNRVNSLPGFEWDERRQFVTAVLDLDSVPGGDRSGVGETQAVELSETVENLVDRLDRLQQQVDALAAAETAEDSGIPFDDPELTRKVIHACMDAEEITDEEEARILESFLEG